MILNDKLDADADAVYSALMDAHSGLSEVESHAMNARLVLIMANHIADADTLNELFQVARNYADD